jgi:hypothetical protein
VSPLLQSIELRLNGPHAERRINASIEENLGQAAKLYVTSLPNIDLITNTNKESPCDCNYSLSSHCQLYRDDLKHKVSREILDNTDHQVVLIPPFSKKELKSFDVKREFKFPFQSEFRIDGQTFSHTFHFPLTFHSQPQRLRLRFRATAANGQELIIHAHFTIYSIIPSVSDLGAGSIQIYENKGTSYSNIYESGISHSLKSSLDNVGFQGYLKTGRRIRYSSSQVPLLTHQGYKVGFNYMYDVKAKPNREMQEERRRSKAQARTKLGRQIRWDLKDYQAYLCM